jgi:hypothetical protein
MGNNTGALGQLNYLCFLLHFYDTGSEGPELEG